MKHLLSRRNLLRGVGVCLALPWLESLASRPARADAPGGPKRFLLVSYPNGAPHPWWDKAPAFGTSLKGNDFTLPVVLDAFAPLKSKMLMVSRLGNYTWRKDATPPEPAIEPAHSRLMAAMTTCVDADAVAKANGTNDLTSAVFNGVSVDQLIVQQADLGKKTTIPSLQTGLGVKPGFFDYRSYAYNQAVSWKSPKEPLKRQVNPKAVFDALVAGGAVAGSSGTDPDSIAAAKLRAATEQSVIDAVRDDANSLMGRVSTRDRGVLQEYLDSLRGIEKTVTSVASTMPSDLGCNPIATPGAVPEPPGPQQGLNQGDDGYDHEAHANVMNDLIAMAIQCDVTRVVTHMLDDARSEFEYRHIPAADRMKVGLEYHEGSSLHFHACQHGPGEIAATPMDGSYPILTPSNLDFTAINYWLSRKTAELALKLDAIKEGDGTVLDHTVMVFMSEMRTHDHDGYDLPIVMLGGGGVFQQNAHVAYQPIGKDRQLRDLWFTIMRQYYKMDITSFGESADGAPNALLEEILV
ncbi:Hypothetical protein A7982_05939 [Minicystis rosea]|nr:Hypothetical protein A7982_05939 [Minicystis rosea]